jgi:hypothetical protein
MSILRSTEVLVLHSVAEVSEAFLKLATRLQARADVRRAKDTIWIRLEERVEEDHFRIGQGEGFRVEWYTEGEFSNGRDLSFGQELSWHDGAWFVEASVRNIYAAGEDLLIEFPRRCAVEAEDLVGELRSQTRLLLDHEEESIRLFLQDDQPLN